MHGLIVLPYLSPVGSESSSKVEVMNSFRFVSIGLLKIHVQVAALTWLSNKLVPIQLAHMHR